MDMKPESDRYQAIITQLALLMDRVHYLVVESRKIQQNTLYFDGYFDGLRYALSIVQLTEQEEKHGNP
jgi:hypothetical protein